MASQTREELQNAVIYSLFVRNFSQEGTFKAVIPELDRIKALGTEIIWFLPFYPVGEIARKGSVGSPYAIKDYRAVDPRLGNLADFEELCQEIHNRGMKVMIDIVYNHTSPDSELIKEHPDWFYHKPDGSFGNRVGDWTDIVDLDYANKDLWAYQIETLKLWVNRGVDGFRCDVAPLIPLAFWQEARRQVEQIKPDSIWLSESIEPGFIRYMRGQGITALSDGEIYQAFDMTYDYDVRDLWVSYLEGNIPLSRYIDRLNLQEVIFPANYIKMRNLENHDNKRAKALIPNQEQLMQWLAFSFIEKGATLIYNGQENSAVETPSLFEKDTIDWSGQDISGTITTLAELKKKWPIKTDYQLLAADAQDAVILKYQTVGGQVVAIFAFKEQTVSVAIDVADGDYQNSLDDSQVKVSDGHVKVAGQPIILFLEG